MLIIGRWEDDDLLYRSMEQREETGGLLRWSMVFLRTAGLLCVPVFGV